MASTCQPLKAGVATADITPPVGIRLMGYPDPYGRRTAERVRDHLRATALILETGDLRVALISLDVILLEDSQVDAIREGVHAKTGIAPSQILVAATHTHSGPRTFPLWGWAEVDAPYVEQILVPRAIEAAASAASATRSVHMGVGSAVSEVGINRREIGPDHRVILGQNPWGPFDATLTVLRFDGEGGPLANVVHYGAHPTVLGSGMRVISRDWPGVLVGRMEQLTGAVTLFLNGASGDVAPRTSTMRAIGDGEAALAEAGGRAAADAMRVWHSIRRCRPKPPLACLAESYDLKYRPLPALADAEQQLRNALPEKDVPGRPMSEYLHWKAVVEAHQQAPLAGKAYRQVLIALGPVAFVPFPGEPFAEIGMRLRKLSPFSYTLPVGTACGHNGYLCTRESLARGGYEVWVSKAFGAYLLAENIDDILVEENAKLLDRLADAMPS